MSNVIPIVSSSPPPFDDDGGWDDDEDDDFGNFASAPNTSLKDGNRNDFFEVDWSASDAFQNPGESPDGFNSFHKAPTPPNGVTDGLNQVLDLKSSNYIVSNLETDGSSTVLEKEEDSPNTDFHQNSFSNIPNHAVDGALSSGSNVSSELEFSNTAPERNSELPKTEESETLTTSKIAECVVSNASITDSGVFSSDLSPSSYPESSSNLQNSCDNHSSPNSYLSVTAEISDTNCNIDSKEKNSQLCFEESQANENSSQNEISMPDNFSESYEHGENGSDWDNFNDAHSFNSKDEENLSLPAFEDDVHATDTADKVSNDILKGNFQHSVQISTYGSNGCEKSEEEEENKEHLSHTSSNKNSAFLTNTDAHSAAKENSDLDIKNNQEPPSGDYMEKKECNSMSENALEEEPISSESDQSMPHEKNSVLTTQECPLPDEKDGNMVDMIENKTDLCIDTSVLGESETKFREDRTQEESIISVHNDEGDNDKTEDLFNAVTNQSDEIDDSILYEERESSSITAKGEALDSHIHEKTGVNIVRNTKDGDDSDDTEFGSFGKEKSDLSDEVTPITFRTSVCESGEDEKEDVDKEKPPAFPDDDDNEDFGDFGDFSSMPAAGLPGGADDFGDFDSGIKEESEKLSSSFRDDDDFGEFGDASASGDQDGGWADFGSSSAPVFDSSAESSAKEFVTTSSQAVATTSQSKGKISMALEKCFLVDMNVTTHGSIPLKRGESLRDPESTSDIPEEEITGLEVVIELGLANPREAKQQTWTVVEHPAKKDPRVRVWGQMKDVDGSHALGYSWPTSHCSQEVFNTLHIDTQNILFTQKKQAVPFFASGLGILEPTRGGNSATDMKKDKNTALSMPIQPTLLDTTANNIQPSLPTSQDIPPVDFDWSVSGLTNPLTVFKSDAEAGTTTQPGLQPLEEMLKKSTPTAKLTPQEKLSQEAQSILTKMPDLSFMQSKVLMFPVKQ